jgi:hypothetical protein
MMNYPVKCFKCGKPIELQDLVVWESASGPEFNIRLHYDCADRSLETAMSPEMYQRHLAESR